MKLPWLKMRKKTDPELPHKSPLWFGNQSNGEYFRPATKRDRQIERRILEQADENARRLGMDRRDFLASSMGMCTTLFVINEVAGCSSSGNGSGTTGKKVSGKDGGSGGSGSGMPEAGPGGMSSMGADSGQDARLCVPYDSMLDPDAACAAIGGDEFIFDVQTHWFDESDLDRFDLYKSLFGPLFKVTTEDDYITQIFCNSDTTLTVLTSWPGVSCEVDVMRDVCGLPLSNDSMAASRDKINKLAGATQRVINHVQVMAQDAAGIEPQLRIMEDMCARNGVAGWKMYPGAFGGYKMDGDRARQVIEKGLELGVPIFCVHKGLPIGTFFAKDMNYPDDIGPIARAYPDARFVIYHSGICSGFDDCMSAPTEGPYDPNEPMPSGTNALIRSLIDNGIGPVSEGLTPNTNVYAEVGSAINEVRDDPSAAAHFFGKLMKYLGPDHVVWGTDCVIYGSPQQFIEWFRALEIPQSMQDQYGYPPLDAMNKARIFGLNSAKLYGIDVEATRCAVDQCPTAQIKRRLDNELGPRRWTFQEPKGPKTYGEFMQHWKSCMHLGRPG